MNKMIAHHYCSRLGNVNKQKVSKHSPRALNSVILFIRLVITCCKHSKFHYMLSHLSKLKTITTSKYCLLCNKQNSSNIHSGT